MNTRTILVVAGLLLFGAASARATIHQVNNNAGVNADYTSLSDAHDAALPGDTLYVAGSPTSYGSLTLTKKLHIIGPGWFLDENYPDMPNTNPATVSIINFSTGTDGSSIAGMSFGAIYVNNNNITVTRNRSANGLIHIGNFTPSGLENIKITQNYIKSGNSIPITIGQNCESIVLSNNYCENNSNGNIISSPNTSTFVASHNVMVSTHSSLSGKLTAYNAVFDHNIVKNAEWAPGVTSNSYSYNISDSDIFGTSSGNQANVDVANLVFEGSSNGTTDGQWKQRSGSPASGAGQGGADIGMFGGANPYVLSGLPDIPFVAAFVTTGVGTSESGLQVSIKAASGGSGN